MSLSKYRFLNIAYTRKGNLITAGHSIYSTVNETTDRDNEANARGHVPQLFAEGVGIALGVRLNAPLYLNSTVENVSY